MANIIVDGDFSEMKNSNRLVVRDANDFVYVFVNANSGASGNIRAYKSDVAGFPTSFTEQDAANAPNISTSRENLAIAIDSAGLIHCTYADTQTGRGAPARAIRYATFRTSAHATSQDVWDTVDELIASPAAAPDGDKITHEVGIAVDANDDPHVIWSENIQVINPNNLLRYNNRIGGSWNATVAVDTVGDDNYSGADIIIGDPLSAVGADRPIIVNGRDLSGVAGQINVSYGNALNATGFTTEDDITDWNGAGPSIHGIGFVGNNMSIAIDSNKKITIAFCEHTTQDLMIVEHLHADAWTVWQTAADVDTSTNYEYPNIIIDGTNRYIFVKDDTASDINLWKDTGSGFTEETDHDDLPNEGTFDFPLGKWANYNNNNSDQFDYVFSDASDVLYNTFPAEPIPPPPSGVLISGQHATELLDTRDPDLLDKRFLKEQQEQARVAKVEKARSFVSLPRREQKIPFEFTFKTQSALLTRKELKIYVKSTLRVTEKSVIKIKSSILNKFKETYGIKASTLLKESITSFKLKSCTLTLKKVQAGLFANMESLTKQQYKKKKESLLRKLKEVLDDGN